MMFSLGKKTSRTLALVIGAFSVLTTMLLASQAFAPTPYGGPFFGGSRVDDLVILTAAFGTAHIWR